MTVKYIIRAIKYFFYFSFLLVLLMAILVFAHVVDANVETMFRDGYKSLAEIAAMFACVAAIYPVFGFVRKSVVARGAYGDIRGGVIGYLESRGYMLEKEDGENLYFRKKAFFDRLSRMFEDRISLTREMDGFRMEGLRKDAIRLICGLEACLREKADD